MIQTSFIAALRNIDPDITAEEIADILWFARLIEESDATSAEINRLANLSTVSVKPRLPRVTGEPFEPDGPTADHHTQTQRGGELHAWLPASPHVSGVNGLGMLPFKTPASAALPGLLEIGRSLRPFRRRVPSRTQHRVDVSATTRQIAEQNGNLWGPVLCPELQRWFDVFLVVDCSLSMDMWWQTVTEWRKFLEMSGAFRTVRVWSFATRGTELVLAPGQQWSQKFWTTKDRGVELPLAPNRDTLVLVITDCVSMAWHNGVVAKRLASWGKVAPVTVVNVLPRRLWHRTSLGRLVEGIVSVPSAGAPNSRFEFELGEYGTDDESDVPDGMPVPVVSLEPSALKLWADAMTSGDRSSVSGYLLPRTSLIDEPPLERYASQHEEEVSEASIAIQPDPRELVRRFASYASPLARRLLSLLAAAPISLPVVRVVQRSMAPNARRSHIAEVLLSGLIERLPADYPVKSPDDIRYDFVPGIRAYLLNSLPMDQAGTVLEQVSDFVNRKAGQAFDFRAWVSAPAAGEDMSSASLDPACAVVAEAVLRRLGGPYATLADQLIDDSPKQLMRETAKVWQGHDILEVTDHSFEADVLRANKPVAMLFWAPWDTGSLMTMPAFEMLASEHQGKLVFARLNTDENVVVPPRYGIQGIPSLIGFDKGKSWLFVAGRGGSGAASLYDNSGRPISRRKLDECIEILLAHAEVSSPTGLALQVSDGSFGEVVLGRNSSVILLVWTPSNDASLQLTSAFDSFAKEYQGKVTFAKLNADENAATVDKLGLRSSTVDQKSRIPALLTFVKGLERKREVGLSRIDALKKYIEDPYATVTSGDDDRRDPRSFGELLRSIRTRRDLKQSELAEAIGRSVSYVSLIESNRRHLTQAVVSDLTSVLNLSADEKKQLDAAVKSTTVKPTYLPVFMCHAHVDNTLTDPYAEALNRLGVPLYYDRVNTQPGNSLALTLQNELEHAKVLIVMVSPAMLESFWVEQEIAMFFELMAEDPTRKLIPVMIAPCEMPTRLQAHWWFDATREPFDAIIDQLARALEVTPEPSIRSGAEPFSRVVDWRQGMGDHTTIFAAIAAAQPGERILVRRGVYEGSLTIDKPLELIGDGQPGNVKVRASGANVITFTASQGRVANLTLSQMRDTMRYEAGDRKGGGKRSDDWYGVDIAAGRLELEDCDISSQSFACVAIRNAASPILRRNRIHDGKTDGIMVFDQGSGLLEDNDIFTNTRSGVEISQGGAPTLRGNRIHDNRRCGVFVRGQGQGLLEGNDIFTNTLSGVEVTGRSNPTLRRNRIHDGKSSGVFVNGQGQGLLEDNEIVANAYAGVEIKTGGVPTLRRNRIRENGYQAIWVYEQGGGVFEGNDLRDNIKGPWSIGKESEEKVVRRDNIE